jgi:hypothetical protein
MNLSEYYEIQYWLQKFGVTPEQLRDAVHKVGNSVCTSEAGVENRASRLGDLPVGMKFADARACCTWL